MSWYIDAKNTTASVSYTVGPQAEYSTLDAALAAIAASGVAATIQLDPSVSYTTSASAFPAVPVVIYGNGATLTTSGALTVAYPYTAYDLNAIYTTSVTFAAAAANTRFIIRNGSRKGVANLTAGILDMQGCTQTWNTTSDKLTVSGTGILTEIGCINTLPIVQNSASSVVFIENCNWNTARASTALLESSAGQFSVANTVVVNTGATSTGIYIHNGQTASAPNTIASCVVAAPTAVNIASGVTLYSKVAATGTTTLTTTAPVPDLVSVAVGQVGLPSLSQGTALTLAATTAPNILATAAFTLTLPAASATYRGMTWAVSSAGQVVTYSGTFKYSTAKGTWTTVTGSTYASSASSLLHYVYCDGATWLISLE